MQDNRNSLCGCNDNQSTVCISTMRVLDSCRDRDCFEDARVYLTALGEDVLNNATNIRTRSANIVCTFVGVDEVAFNDGFFRVSVKYYVELELEACLGLGRSQLFKGVAVLQKEVILYGGEGNTVSFASDTSAGFCDCCNKYNKTTNAPVAVVEAIEPIVLSTKIQENCPCNCSCDCGELPAEVMDCIDGELVTNSDGARLLVSFGIFSVVRIERPTQLLVQATDYSVPDKECVSATNDENPCAFFSTMPFPSSQFRTATNNAATRDNGGGRGCGCNR